MKTHATILSILLVVAVSATNASDVVQVSSKSCTPGTHKQPNGLFALFVFCNEGFATDVAVFLHDIGNPIGGKYSRGRRFWQGEKWGWSATSYSWIDEKHLLVGTSFRHGSGSVFLLNLEAQTYQEVLPRKDGDCISRLLSVNNKNITVEITKCETGAKSTIEITL